MRLSILAAALLSSVPALAEIYTAQDDFHYSLSRAVVTSATDGDLHVSMVGVSAAHGAKRMSREGAYQSREVLVLGEPYSVKDANGRLWRMSIKMSANRVIEVELMQDRPERKSPQIFNAVSVRIDGADAKPTFAELELGADGAYRLGTAHGVFERDGAGVNLGGVPSQWGRGTLGVDGASITFRYQRGQSIWEVKYVETALIVAER